MNGRIYDPKLGRMLSPDPVTQAPEIGQNYNRYTYANNNPLKYTDPSGFYTELVEAGGNGGSFWPTPEGFLISSAIGWSLNKVFGGDGCDRTCRERQAAHNWCKAQAWCFTAIQQVKEKFRKRSALALENAYETGEEWEIQNRRVVTGPALESGDALTNDGQIIYSIPLVEFVQLSERRFTPKPGADVIFTYEPHPNMGWSVVRWVRIEEGRYDWKERIGKPIYDPSTRQLRILWNEWEPNHEFGQKTGVRYDYTPFISGSQSRTTNPWTGEVIIFDINSSGDLLDGVVMPPDPDVH